MQGSARKDVVFGAARVYTFTAPGPKWKSWFDPAPRVPYLTGRSSFRRTRCHTRRAEARFPSRDFINSISPDMTRKGST